MARIFSGLAGLSLILLVANLVIGLVGGDYNADFARIFAETQPIRERWRDLKSRHPQPTEELRKVEEELAARYQTLGPVQQWTTWHVLLGIAAALVAVLVNSISVTYFIGTARWCREVCETYSLGPELSLRCDAIKGQTFPWSLGSVVMILVLLGLGAAAHPGARITTAAGGWVLWHHTAAWITVAVLAWSYFVQSNLIAENSALIEQVTDEVRRIRKERGLDEEEE